jgi:hypothetical protein
VCQARLQAVVNALGKGAAVVLGTPQLNGQASATQGVLATVPLATPAGSISGVTLTLAGLPMMATAHAKGTLARAELRNAAGTVVVSGLTIGLVDSSADIIVGPVTNVISGARVTLLEGSIIHA